MHYLSTYTFPRADLSFLDRPESRIGKHAASTAAHLRCSNQRRHTPVRAAPRPRLRRPCASRPATAPMPQSKSSRPQRSKAPRRPAEKPPPSSRRPAREQLPIAAEPGSAAPLHLNVKPARPQQPCAISTAPRVDTCQQVDAKTDQKATSLTCMRQGGKRESVRSMPRTPKGRPQHGSRTTSLLHTTVRYTMTLRYARAVALIRKRALTRRPS